MAISCLSQYQHYRKLGQRIDVRFSRMGRVDCPVYGLAFFCHSWRRLGERGSAPDVLFFDKCILKIIEVLTVFDFDLHCPDKTD